MTARRRRPILLFFSLLVLGLAIGLFVLSRRMNQASDFLAASLTGSLRREVRVGSVRWRPWGQVLVDGVTVARWERLSEGPGLQADRLIISVDPLALLRRRLHITRLELTRPRLWVEVTADGRSNWENLLTLRHGTQWQSEWSGITVREGAVFLLDRRHDVTVEAEGIQATLAVKSGDVVSGGAQGVLGHVGGKWAGHSLDLGPLSAKLTWAGQAVTVEKFEVARARTRLASGFALETAGGLLTGGGNAQWSSGHPEYQLSLIARNFHLADLWPGMGLVGTVGGAISMAGSGWGRDGVAVEATLELRDGGVSREGDRLPPRVRARLAQLGPIWQGAARLRYRARRLELLALKVEGRGQQIELQGEIHERHLALRGEGASTDLAVWAPQLRGQISLAGELTGSLDDPHLVLQLDGRVQGWGEVPLGKIAAHARLGREGLVLDSFLIEEGDGRVTGSGRLRWVPNGTLDSLTYEGTSRVEGIDFARLVGLVHRDWPLTGQVNGSFSVKGQGREVGGKADLTLSRGAAWGERIESGRASLTLAAGTLRVALAELRGAWGRISLQGEGSRTALQGHMDLRDLRLEALQAVAIRWPGLEGRGELRAELGGSHDQLNLRGTLTLTDVGRGEVSLGSVSGVVSITNQRLSITASLPTLRTDLQGEVDLREPRPFSATLRGQGVPLKRLQVLSPLAFLSWVSPLEGEASGSARFHGELARVRVLALEATLDHARISVDGQTWESRGPLRVAGSLERLDVSGEFQTRQGQLRIGGRVEPGRAWDLMLDGTVPLKLLRGERFHAALRGLSGLVRGHITVRGPWATPVPSGLFSLDQVRLAPDGWPAVELARAEARVDSGELIVDRVEGRVDGGRFEAAGHVTLQGVAPQAFSLRLGITELTLQTAQLARLIRRPGALPPGGPEASAFWEEGKLGLSGLLEMEGIWGRLDTLKFRGRFARLLAESGRLQWINETPIQLALRDGTLSLEPFTMTGGGTRLTLSGRAGPARQLDLRVRGSLSLALLEQMPQYVREASGNADLQLALQGDWQAPRVDGILTISSTRLNLRRIPEPLILKEGRLRFDGVRLSVDRLSGEWGEGAFTLTGWAERGPGLSLKSLHFTLKGSTLRFRVADLGHGALDLDLEVEGDGSRPLVRGELVLRRTVYSRDLQPTVPRRLRRWEEVVAALPPPLRAVRFDVTLRAPGDVWIQNNLARVEIKGDLTLKGTFTEPILFGQAEVVQGSVVYRQREFRILAGRVDFLDPRRINPQFTVSAETLAQGVRVHLTLMGRLDRFTVQLASDPPLSQQQIQALVAGGAATFVVGGGLPGKILEGAGRIAKLDVFQIEPTSEEKGVGARVSAGKRLGERLEVTYSRTISSSPTQRVNAEYRLTDAISLIGSQDERGAYSFDVRFSLSFP